MSVLSSEIGTSEQVRTVLGMYPDAEPEAIRWVDSGVSNIVGLVDTAEGGRCFRFARTEEGRKLLEREHSVLEIIHEHDVLAVPTPKPLYLADDGSYVVQTRLDGRNIDENELHGHPEEIRSNFGKTIGNFIVGMNDIFQQETYSAASMPVSPNDWHDLYVATHATEERGRFRDVFDYFFDLYSRSLAKRHPEQVVIHGDLHYGNVLFDEQVDLCGVIDFGEAGRGCIHRELRSVYRTGGRVALDATAEVLDCDGRFGPIDVETITHQATVHEIAIVIEASAQQCLHAPRAALADASLKRWIGDAWIGLQPA
jgi:aminoglycoside phosphotransferase